MQQSTVLVTGSTGFVGAPLIKHLSAMQQQVVAVYHHRLPEPASGIYPVCSDLGSPELIAAPLRGVDCVVHLAWKGGLTGPRQVPSEASVNGESEPTENLRVLRNLIRAMEKAGTRRLVFLSALGASKDSESRFLIEKYWGEYLILNSKIPEKVIIRSSVVWGGRVANDRFLNTLVKVLRFPIYPVPRLGPQQVSPIYINDLRDILIGAMSQQAVAGAALLEVKGGETYNIKELFKIVSSLYLKKTRIPAPGLLSGPLLKFLERDRANGKSLNPSLRDCLAMGGAQEEPGPSNPLSRIVPDRLASFRERITD